LAKKYESYFEQYPVKRTGSGNGKTKALQEKLKVKVRKSRKEAFFLHPPRRTGGQFTSDNGFDQRGPPPKLMVSYGGQNTIPYKS
jgi:hypothetical protein